MKKYSILALLIGSSLAMSAYADNVTIYGLLFTTVDYTKIENGPSNKGMTNNASRLGLRGEEKLTDDLAAEFQIETGVDTSGVTANSNFGKRESYLGLKSKKFGNLRLTNFFTPMFFLLHGTAGALDEIGRPSYSDGGTVGGTRRLSGIADLGQRLSDSIYYRTPNFGELFADVQVSKGNVNLGAAGVVNPKFNHVIDGRVQYGSKSTPLVAGASVRTAKMVSGKDNDIYMVALKYQRDIFNIGTAYEHDNYKDYNNGTYKDDKFFVTGQYNINSQFSLVASVGYATDAKVNGVTQDNTHATQGTVGALYDLSKRTRLYAYYVRLNNGTQANYSFNTPVSATAKGINNEDFSLGVRHIF